MRYAAFLAAVLAVLVSAPLQAQRAERPLRPVHTFSIVARDSTTGQLGVAVQSHWFSVGSVVSWAEPGVGAVATQSFVEVSYGPLGLELMRAGKGAGQALAALLAGDPHGAVRQVAMVDARGRVAAHTGDDAIADACDRQGAGYSVQANLMLNPTVCDAMAAVYESADGDLAERLLLALEAAQREGGDIRGKQSAALLVVSGDRSQPSWGGRVFDLRIEDHPQPLEELRRLLTLARAYNYMNQGDELVTRGDIESAVEAYSIAEVLAPESHEMVFWHAATLAGVGRIEEALPLFRRAFTMWPNWRTLVPRLPAAGLLPDDQELIDRIVNLR
ncbi:MAG: DUF1028 domain-containing protein [Gemmatimonadales bacterium]|jgi:uncharacterized Ntn-hydrolase superfamily protein